MHARLSTASRLAAIGATVLVFLAGCSRGLLDRGGASLSRSGYESRTAVIDATLRAKFVHAAALLSAAARPRQLAAAYDLEAGALATAASELSHVTPPNELEHAHLQLIDGLRRLGGELEDAAGRMRAGRVASARAMVGGLAYSPPAIAVRQATAAMRSHGYAVFVTR